MNALIEFDMPIDCLTRLKHAMGQARNSLELRRWRRQELPTVEIAMKNSLSREGWMVTIKASLCSYFGWHLWVSHFSEDCWWKLDPVIKWRARHGAQAMG